VKDLILSLARLKSHPDITSIRSIFDQSHINFTNSGRASLYVILKALQLPENSKIGVPLYTCPTVFDAIINAGHKPIFIDIDPGNYTLDPDDLEAKINELDAVLAIHTFGRPADMDKIQKIAGDVPVIEDCAHALLSRYKNKLVGTIGNAGFFSFRTGKYISAGEGGMIITKDAKLSKKIQFEIERFPKPTLTNEIKSSFVTFARSTMYHRPWFGLFALPIGGLLENKIDLMNKYNFKTTQIRKTDMHTILRKIENFKIKVDIQRENSQYLINNLKGQDILLPEEATDTFCNYYLFPVQFKDRIHRDMAVTQLLKKGIDTTKLFSKTPELAKRQYGYKGDCPDTEQVAEKILTIPNHYTLNRCELDKTIYAVREFFKNESTI
jgi:dTDP-4-amino-4,6-dideoxygalactose transaminase